MPLLLPPAYVPFAGDSSGHGERMHIRMRRKVGEAHELGAHLGRVASDVKGLVKSTPANLGADAARFVGQVQGWFGLGAAAEGSTDGGELGTNYLATKPPPPPPPPPPRVELRALNLRGMPGPRPPPEGFALNGGGRVDWVLQESEAELANQYLSALQAHTAYFDCPDVAAFIVRRVCGGFEAGASSTSLDAAVEAEAVAAGGGGTDTLGRRTRTSGGGDLFDRTGSSLTEPF